MNEKYQNATTKPASKALTDSTCSLPKKVLVSENTYRSNPHRIDQSDDMVRVTIDMKRNVWWAWKRKMFPAENKTKQNTMKVYKTRKSAQDAINDLDQIIYHLSHGEYTRPHYTARKVRGADRYYIHARYHYYEGAFYSKKSGKLN